ncbi:6-phosphogluconolactonase [Asticcacaulis sp. AND118]|uniref:6-phosphogluconolactonase n=1 Tax=Asticcacaulis sp. AND118 TaxID=2840468 RepID=UPI001CFFAFC5|nr:6-phosphogluconolactonase [Asticcacaulis sp. AND118]UDF03152.1 6-phosphogluconolactonase [Asticcacaulis sp. AND118]
MTEALTFGKHAVRSFASAAQAEKAVLAAIGEALSAAIAERGRALWIGAGGGTPKPVYQQLDTLDLPWDKVILSQVDERFVPVDDAASNTKMMAEAAAPVIAKGMVFETLIRDINDAGASAEKAEALLRGFNAGEAPAFDLTLMGMGPDKHYASIFPGHPINATVYDTETLVLPVEPATGGTEPKLPRITLSVKALNGSRRIVLYITGQEKLEALKAAVADPDPGTAPIGAFLAQCPVPIDIVWCP